MDSVNDTHRRVAEPLLLRDGRITQHLQPVPLTNPRTSERTRSAPNNYPQSTWVPCADAAAPFVQVVRPKSEDTYLNYAELADYAAQWDTCDAPGTYGV